MVAGLAAAVAVLVAGAFDRGRPVPLPDIGAQRLPCVSYAPYRRPGHTPFDPALRVTQAQIEQDLRQLRAVTGCIRTYGVDHGLDAVPAVAGRLGLRVVLGAWIGRDPVANEAQLARALELGREHPETVELLVVGNEVLLRRELAPQALADLLARARREAAVPVAYADVWEFWLRHAAVLRDHVDVVAAHVLPYWEDEPIGVEHAVDHVHAIATRLQVAFAPQPVFIGETGWPAFGRQRGPAVPGTLEQARFVRELLARQAERPLAFNLIEAFDQPWKRALEGAMGGAWGLFDATGRLRVPMSGPVVPDPHWRLPMWAGAIGAVAGALWASRRPRPAPPRPEPGIRRRSERQPVAVLATALAVAGVSMIGVWQWHALAIWSRTPLEWTIGGITALASSVCALAAAARLACRLAAPGAPTGVADAATPVARRGVVELLRDRAAAVGDRTLAIAHAVLLFAAGSTALALVFDARYRALDALALAAPAVLLFALAALGDRLDRDAREERVLAAVCAGGAVLVAVQEGAANTQALVYALALATLAAATLWPHRGAAVAAGRASTRAASSTAGADSPVE